MSSKTTTNNPATGIPYHDLFFKDVLASFPEFRKELIELSLPSALRSELDTDHIDYQTEILRQRLAGGTSSRWSNVDEDQPGQ